MILIRPSPSLAYWLIDAFSLPGKVKSTRSLGGALNPINDLPSAGEDRGDSNFLTLPMSRSNKMASILNATCSFGSLLYQQNSSIDVGNRCEPLLAVHKAIGGLDSPGTAITSNRVFVDAKVPRRVPSAGHSFHGMPMGDSSGLASILHPLAIGGWRELSRSTRPPSEVTRSHGR